MTRKERRDLINQQFNDFYNSLNHIYLKKGEYRYIWESGYERAERNDRKEENSIREEISKLKNVTLIIVLLFISNLIGMFYLAYQLLQG